MKEHSKNCSTNQLPNIAAGNAIPRDCDCDGYHTFEELYEHRIRLFIALCKMYYQENQHHAVGVPIWCSTKHSDGSSFGDWFVLGLFKEKGKQITYHLPARFWSEVCEFAEVLPQAPEWDGHTSNDVLKRLTPPVSPN